MPEIYDICIVSPKSDAEIARTLADSIRRYRLPRTVSIKGDLDYRRILLDCDETPMDGAVREQLDASRFLALICSPDTRQNKNILDRLEYFRNAHGQEEIIAIIVRGEPIDSFPESFIEKKVVRHIMPDMSIVERVDTIEPVAADLRAETRKRQREVLRYETVRITASILGLHPDDLEQRHRARRKRAVMAALSVVGAVCLVSAAIFLRLGYIAKTEGDIAEQQTELSVQIAQRTMQDLPEMFEEEADALGYIDEAIENARGALDEIGLADLLDAPETERGS